jgi:hypothetical protein
MDGETVTDALPEIKANLATLGNVDPKSVTMRISGLGLVPATYDPATKLISYKVTQKLYTHQVTVIVSATVQRKEDGGSLVLQHRFQRCSQRGSQKGVTTHSLLFVSSSRRELARADRRHNWLKDALRRPSEVFVGGLFMALAHPEQPRRNHLIQPIHMYGERTIWLGLDNQQIDLQFLYRIAQRIASYASHDTPLDFYFVLGKGVGQVLQPSFEVSGFFSARRGNGRGKRPVGDDDGDAPRTQDLDGLAQQLAVFLLRLWLQNKYDMLRQRRLVQRPRHQ